MKAITVNQPYATLIARGVKTIETRPAPPNGPMRAAGARGLPGCAIEPGERIAIHAGGPAGKADPSDPAWLAMGWPDRFVEPLVFGVVLCTAIVTDCAPIGGPYSFRTGSVEGDEGDYPDRPVIVRRGPIGDWLPESLVIDHGSVTEVDDQLPLGDFTEGRWGWLLADVERIPEPVPCRGKQGVWRLPDDVAEAAS